MITETGMRPGWGRGVARIAGGFALAAIHLLVAVALVHVMAWPVLEGRARASVESAMEGYFDDMSVAANVTGPTAYQGQAAGYYSLGNVWTRFPQKTTNFANLQLPRVNAGCGGIDVFTGSFSFINAPEIVALLKATANNAVGFAFKLAIDTLCPECGKIMEEMRQAAQLMNNQSMSSCEAAQGIVGGVWPKSDAASKTICESIGNSTGLFSDWAAARQGCGSGDREATIESVRGNPEWDDVNVGLPRNYTWHVLKKSAFFQDAGGTLDRELAEYVMTLIGTIISVPATDSAEGSVQVIGGDQSSTLVSALLDGTVGGTDVKIWTCDAGEEDDACLNPTLQNLSVDATRALRPKVAAILDDMVEAVRADTAIGADALALLQVASIPLYKILTVQAAYSRGIPNDDRATLAEITAVDLLFVILDQVMTEVGKARSQFIAGSDVQLAQWKEQHDSARQMLMSRQGNTQARVSAIMQIIERTTYIESVLQTSMSPGMTASLDWSRAVTGRSL